MRPAKNKKEKHGRLKYHLNRMALFLLLLLIYRFPLYAQVQVYPVSVTTQIIPPYSVSLPDYASPGSEQLKVIILQRDLTQAPYRLYLKMEIELNGRTIIRTSPGFIPEAFTLDPGIPTLISGSTLAQYFEPANMEFTGYSRDQYIRTRMLPEGAYVITFTAYDWTRREVALSRGGSFFCYLAKSEPPLLNLPVNNAIVAYSSPQYITFQWLSRTASSPNSANSTKYRFELFEMRVGGISPSEIVTSTRPFYTTETDQTNLVYTISEPPLEKGLRYVWRVRAFDLLGRDYIRNNGFSEVFSFVYGEEGSRGVAEFNGIENFTTEALTPKKAKLSWEVSPQYGSYRIYYRKKGSGNKWYESETMQNSSEISGLSPGETYECKVQGKQGITWGGFSSTEILSMPLLPKIECGSPFEPLNVSNRVPLPELMRLQEFDAGGFMVTLVDSLAITSSPGRFSGKGYVQVPLFGHKKIRCEFTDIFINTDYQMVEGSIRLITDNRDGRNAMWDIDEVFEGGSENGTVIEGTEEVSLIIPDMVISNAGALILDTALGEILVINEFSDTIRFDVAGKLQESRGTLTVQDSEGNLYSIDSQTGKATSIGRTTPPGSNQQIAALPDIIDTRKGKVIFEPVPGQTKYAFDVRSSQYARSNLFNGEYKTMQTEDGSLYDIPYKLIPAGETDVVLARPQIRSKSVPADSIVFRSGAGTIYNAQFDYKKGEYLLNLPAGKTDDGIEIFATYTDKKRKTSVLGKMIVMTYSFISPKLILVPVNDNGSDIDPDVVKEELDKVYKTVAVDWQVAVDTSKFSAFADSLNIKGSGLFSQYTDGMKKLNSEFVQHKGTGFDPTAIYLFLLQVSGDESATGDMPRSRQFGYIFTRTAGKGEALFRTIAHEIAHGAFSLIHTFDSKYKIPEKTTDNLLDYTAGTALVKHQWDAIHDPGLVIGMFERDEEGMSILNAKWTLIDSRHTILLNHVYKNNNKGNLKYLEKIETANQLKPKPESVDLDYQDRAEEDWIESWKLRTASSDEILSSIIQKIQDAKKGEKIKTLSLAEKGIYIGKYEIEGVEYPIAIYSTKKDISNLVKVQVASEEELDKEENKKYLRSEETLFKYLIIAFYEEGLSEPSIIFQIEKFNFSQFQDTKEKWLQYLSILANRSSFPENNVNLKIFEGNEEKSENSIFMIKASPPSMPDVRASAESNDTIRLRLKIEYIARKTWTDNRGTHTNELVRDDVSWFPIDGWQDVESGEVWDIDFGNLFRGGKAYLFCKINSTVVDTIVFHIRGENPSEADVHNYVNTLTNADKWYVPKMIRQESSFHQFNPGVSSAANTSAGMPNWGPPYGWGMKQLDNLGSNYGYRTVLNGTVVREGGASPDELWNWQLNVSKGIQFFNGAKRPTAETRWNNAMEDVKDWEEDYEELIQDAYLMFIIASPLANELNITVTEIIAGNATNSEIIVSKSNPTGNQRSLIDAHACKYYNGGNNYFTIEIPANQGRGEPQIPQWHINKLGNGRDYVNDISGRTGW